MAEQPAPAKSWILREAVIFIIVFAIILALLPVLLAAIAYQSRQSMFWPAYEALYTYFLPYTILVSAAIASIFMVIRLAIRIVRRSTR